MEYLLNEPRRLLFRVAISGSLLRLSVIACAYALQGSTDMKVYNTHSGRTLPTQKGGKKPTQKGGKKPTPVFEDIYAKI